MNTTTKEDKKARRREVLQALIGVMVGVFVAMTSLTIVGTSLPTMIKELHGSQTMYTWVITASMLSSTIATIIAGKLADQFHKKHLLMAGFALFAFGSLLSGFAWNTGALIGFRIVQGLGLGHQMSLSQVVIATVTSPRERGQYNGYLGAVIAFATVAGPVFGGFIVDLMGWRWCFYVGVPFAIAAAVVLQKTLHLPTIKRPVRIDYLGAMTIAGGVSLLLVWVSLAGHQFDWASWETAVMVPGGIALLALTVLVESRASEPIIPLRLFENRTVVLASLASLFVGVGLFASTIFLGQYFQLARGDSPMMAGVMTTPLILGLFVTSTVSGRAVTRTGRWKVWLVAGAATLTVGLLLMSRVGWDTTYWLVAPAMLVVGAGTGMMMQNLVVAVQNEVSGPDLGAASSFVAFTRTMGGAFGVSALGALLGHRVEEHTTEGLAAAGIHPPEGHGGRSIPSLDQLPAPMRPIVQAAYGDGIAEIFLAGAPFAFFALVLCLLIRERALRETTS